MFRDSPAHGEEPRPQCRLHRRLAGDATVKSPVAMSAEVRAQARRGGGRQHRRSRSLHDLPLEAAGSELSVLLTDRGTAGVPTDSIVRAGARSAPTASAVPLVDRRLVGFRALLWRAGGLPNGLSGGGRGIRLAPTMLRYAGRSSFPPAGNFVLFRYKAGAALTPRNRIGRDRTLAIRLGCLQLRRQGVRRRGACPRSTAARMSCILLAFARQLMPVARVIFRPAGPRSHARWRPLRLCRLSSPPRRARSTRAL